jgi:hypothetical protein
MRFRLEVIGGALSYQTVSFALRFGSLPVPLPYWLSPRVTAWEKAVDNMNQIYVSVAVNLPLMGRLIAYDGVLAQVEAQR